MRTTKPACSKEPFTLDWTPFYDEHGLDATALPITSSVWTITGGQSGQEIVASPKTVIFLEGGTPGETFTAKNVIEINGGQYRTCETIYIEVTP